MKFNPTGGHHRGPPRPLQFLGVSPPKTPFSSPGLPYAKRRRGGGIPRGLPPLNVRCFRLRLMEPVFGGEKEMEAPPPEEIRVSDGTLVPTRASAHGAPRLEPPPSGLTCVRGTEPSTGPGIHSSPSPRKQTGELEKVTIWAGNSACCRLALGAAPPLAPPAKRRLLMVNWSSSLSLHAFPSARGNLWSRLSLFALALTCRVQRKRGGRLVLVEKKQPLNGPRGGASARK